MLFSKCFLVKNADAYFIYYSLLYATDNLTHHTFSFSDFKCKLHLKAYYSW